MRERKKRVKMSIGSVFRYFSVDITLHLVYYFICQSG